MQNRLNVTPPLSSSIPASVLIRELPLEYVSHPATWPEAYSSGSSNAPSPSPVDNSLVRVEAGSVTLGKPTHFPRCALSLARSTAELCRACMCNVPRQQQLLPLRMHVYCVLGGVGNVNWHRTLRHQLFHKGVMHTACTVHDVHTPAGQPPCRVYAVWGHGLCDLTVTAGTTSTAHASFRCQRLKLRSTWCQTESIWSL